MRWYACQTEIIHSFLCEKKKSTKDGKAPIYGRVTIDGLHEEFSLSCKVLPECWDASLKQVLPGDPNFLALNKKINQARVDVERHFDLMQAKHGLVTPEIVLQSYTTPISGQQMRLELQESIQFSETLDNLIWRYLGFWEKIKKAHAVGRVHGPEKQKLLDYEKEQFRKEIELLAKKGNTLLDKENRQKTFLLILNDYLLNFLQLAISSNRSPNTLEKWMGRKKRFQGFLQYRYGLEDIPLSKIKHSFIEELVRYCMVQHGVIENTAMKYAQCLKQLMDRAIAKGWVSSNVFVTFKCKYEDPHHDWLTMQELQKLRNTEFDEAKLNVIRGIFVFESFTGLSYQEIRTLSPSDIITGIDGKKWISKNRQKTKGDETLPLLPLPLEILAKYMNYPVCVRRGRLLPVPTNEEYNRCLKKIATIVDLRINLRSHKARFFFANEVAFNNGVPLKIVGRMLGQKSIRTTEVYVRGNREAIATSMDMVERKLFNEEGELRVGLNEVRRLDHSGSFAVENNPNRAKGQTDAGGKVIPISKK